MQISKLPEYFFKLIKNPWVSISYLGNLGLLNLMSDETYLKLRFRAEMGYKLDLKNPKTFCEKLQWLKLHDRRPEYTQMVDKYAVREYIKNTIGDRYLIPLIGVWENPDEIDFDALPNQFVLKCNHNSGIGMCICKDKATLDISKVKDELRKGLKQDYYLTSGREWPYKNVPRKIICEKYMKDDEFMNKVGGVDELTDYKFFCFDGYVDKVMVCFDRASNDPKYYFFDKHWKLVRCNVRGKAAPVDFTLPKPSNMDEMFMIASKLSAGLPHARVDLYSVSGKTYFGEITFFSQSGFDPNILPEENVYRGKLIKLPCNNNLKNNLESDI